MLKINKLEKISQYSDMAVLVISCDRYATCWTPFFSMFYKMWPQFDGQVYLGNNNLDYQFEDKDIGIINIGADNSWCDNVAAMLEKIDKQYVMVFLEDFIIKKPIDNAVVWDAYTFLREEKAGYYRLSTNPRGTKKYNRSKTHRQITPLDYYCVNTSAGIWNKDILKQLLHEGYSAWDFEIKNSKQANAEDRLPAIFLSSIKNQIKIINAITSGKWMPKAVRFLKKNGIVVDTSEFPIMRGIQLFKVKAKYAISHMLPLWLKRFIKRILMKVGFRKQFLGEY